jgi:cytochrome c oxidase cbb3-type subunit IV
MIKSVLEHIGGIANYGIISVLLFFTCFLSAVLWALTRKRTYINKMKHLPLEDDAGEEAQFISPSNSPAKP